MNWLRRAAAATTSFAYDADGLLTQRRLPNGATTTYSYDAAHRLVGIANSAGERMDFTLDGMGNRTEVRVTSPAGAQTLANRFGFDSLGRLIRTIGAAGQVAKYEYDANGNTTAATDPRGAVTRQAFDAFNRVVQVTDALGGIARMAYDPQDNLTSATDAKGLTTTYTYNAFGDVVEMDSPDTGTTVFTVDAAGNVVSKKDARRVVTEYAYDALNRITSKTFPSSPSENAAYTYDDTTGGNRGIGRLTSVADASGTTALGWDAFGNVVAETRTVAGITSVTRYEYDLAGNLTRIQHPSGRVVAYQRDGEGRVVGVTTQANPAAAPVTVASDIRFLPFGPVQSATLGNGLRLSFGYDLLGRLTRAAGPWGSDEIAYDAVGNRLSRTLVSGATTTTISYTYDRGTNRVAKAVASNGTRSMDYDRLGNLISDQRGSRRNAYKFAYGADNRPVSAELPDARVVSYAHDAFGQRVSAAVTGETATRFAYGPSGELLEENGPAGPRTHIRLNGRPLALIDGTGALSWVLSDQVGQPQKMVDAAGTLVWDRVAAPFGETVSQLAGQETDEPERFPGQRLDALTGLHYNFFRDYDPALGRYVQSDPIGLKGGWNTYAYVGGNPVSRIDPLGLSDVVFDRGAGAITITNGNGSVVETYPAANNTTSTSNGPWPDGTYPYSHYQPHPESGPTGPYGSNGNFVFDVPGRTGMGIHSGRSGPQSKTLGCVRTTDEATDFLRRLHRTDTLRTITVR